MHVLTGRRDGVHVLLRNRLLLLLLLMMVLRWMRRLSDLCVNLDGCTGGCSGLLLGEQEGKVI